MAYALPTRNTQYFTRASVDESGMKPILRGVWQNPGQDGALHEILYWLNKNDPQGPTPPDTTDSQFSRWEAGLQLWIQKNGVPAGSPLLNGTSTMQQMIPIGPGH